MARDLASLDVSIETLKNEVVQVNEHISPIAVGRLAGKLILCRQASNPVLTHKLVLIFEDFQYSLNLTLFFKLSKDEREYGDNSDMHRVRVDHLLV